ncbi:glutathione S-transferase family protein [Ruegeria sp. WL0004]|uniref:Glutathione S-transferase family protein n=1 Tax=Ruegeria marisflavi TaxID=2984152 RepID=A0ABT2WKD4_9RHOB|nr:glutathione S-transferase family protein [Ruegeria sp. WL0004]MCU9836152.1 glutathione S-transferase family protein [Ruegeria sp. WL0004]
MLTLLTFPSAFGLYSGSPFCVKAAYMLHLSRLDWRRSDLLDARKMPHGKLPVLRTPERLLADSDAIRNWLEAEGAEFDQGLSDLQRAQSRSMIRMAEDHLYFQLLMDRWSEDEVWHLLRDRFFGEVPRLIRNPVANGVRRSVLRGLRAQGMGRFSTAERMDRAERDLEAITACLWHGSFLLGDRLSAADLSVAPMLAAMRATPVSTTLQRRVAGDRILSDYIDQVDDAVGIS